jgi:outer membrane protein assembly factor BamA
LSLQKLRIELQKFWPLLDKLTLLTRARYDHQWGKDVPFYLESKLGGQSSLRGFRSNRYIDAASQVFNIEPRWSFWEINTSVIKKIELSVAYEFGRVFNYENLPPFDSYHFDWDFGLTFITGADLPIRLDYAVSPESSLFYLHLFQPF